MKNLADELWDKHCSVVGAVNYQKFLAALKEYGEAVRKRDAEVCGKMKSEFDDLEESSPDVTGQLLCAYISEALKDCAAAIEREPLP